MDNQITPESDAIATNPTVPGSYDVSIRGFDTEDHATQFGKLIGVYIRDISHIFDLSQLDGVTIAYDYEKALLDLDRGLETLNRLTPSDTHVIGIAMTPSVNRDGCIKSHIVLNAAFMLPLENKEHKDFNHALHTLVHECAHVEITHKFNSAFPGKLLQRIHTNMLESLRWQVILACWDEYAATLLSARFGQDPTKGYEETFIMRLGEAQQDANQFIAAYRMHGNVEQILGEVFGAYGDLLKFAAYHLGNLNGQGTSLADMPLSTEALADHWFAPYCERLDAACKRIAENYGAWPDQLAFEEIGDLLEEIVAEGGVYVEVQEDNSLYVDIPYSPETMPI